MSFIKTLAELDRADLALAGGKGANLGALVRAGMPVPGGFCVTTPAYLRFVEANGLQARILARLDGLHSDRPDELEAASEDIRGLFTRSEIPPEISAEIRAAYCDLEGAPVAVRSSATAEDLPDLSFAGQQDTYLNIRGEDELLNAVTRCWASLWTARAIGYRARNAIDQGEVALAVVVQKMVASETSGVLFTANPLTGKRSETVIDATLGLGEALVSGMVEPDHYVVDEESGKILKKTLGAKALSIRGLDGSGTRTVKEDAAALQALPDEQILALARLGQRAEQHFGGPQDMEWGWAGGELYVLQSRPVTSLFPLPDRLDHGRLEVFFSFANWQGMLDPYTPLGRDIFTSVIVGLARYFGATTTIREQRAFLTAAERLYVNVTGLLDFPPTRRVVGAFMAAVDPVAAGLLHGLLEEDDPRMAPRGWRMGLGQRLRIARGVLPILAGILYNLAAPARGRARLARRITETLAGIRQRCESARNLAELVEVVENVPLTAPRLIVPILGPGIISGMGPLQVLLRLSQQVAGGKELVLELTRGLPHNVTTEMDLKLWAAAEEIQADPTAAERVCSEEAADLAAEYKAGRLPPTAQRAVEGFLADYGMRGVAEIDLGRPRWNDDPTHIFQVLQSYLEMTDASVSPEAVFRRGAARARQAEQELAEAMRGVRFGWLKSRLVRWLAYRVRELGGLRETPKFTIIRMMGLMRAAMLREGRKLQAAGQLNRSDDLFFLHLEELKEFAAGRLPGADELIARRRQIYSREMGRKRLPRILLSDGTTFYESAAPAGQDGNSLTGSPVSPGVVEGVAHVILDPRGARLTPGEILVCPATDPAWTPLFLAAGGLVMEVGGMMTHGSVVAREYGIPAVVGVSQATTRLQTGQRIRVDGSSGVITVVE